MKTIRTKVYQFSELSKASKQTAIEHFASINVDYDWWQFIYEDAANIGLKITSFDLDSNRHATGEFTISANEVAANIFRDHGESCETYKTATSFMEDWQPVFSNYMDENHEDYESRESEEKLLNMEDEFLKSLLEDYSIMLQKECDYLQTDKAIIETIECNQYDFTKDGKRFNR